MKLLKKLKKSKYLDHKKLLKLAENNIEQFNKNHKKNRTDKASFC